jgi:hypothetical protein
MPASGNAFATPLANANADAAWPDGNERLTIDRHVVRYAVRTAPRAQRLEQSVDHRRGNATDASPLTAARQPVGPPNAASAAALPSHSFE